MGKWNLIRPVTGYVSYHGLSSPVTGKKNSPLLWLDFFSGNRAALAGYVVHNSKLSKTDLKKTVYRIIFKKHDKDPNC
jgi:hypothetical protein